MPSVFAGGYDNNQTGLKYLTFHALLKHQRLGDAEVPCYIRNSRDTLIAMQDEVRIFSSFREAEEADTAFYASLSPQERLDLLLDLIARHRESIGETTERFERVYRVTELSRG
jgi:hypothetical protein